MNLHRTLPALLVSAALVALATSPASAQEKAAAKKAEKPPIKALLITGGCCHDYTAQKKIMPEGISARANVTWTIVQQGGTKTNAKIPYYESEEWAKGFDIVVHNECFAEIPDPAWTAKVLKPHREGLPAVVVHCAMHCYRDRTDEWFKFVGVTSRRHGAHYPFEIVNIAPDNEIMKGFGETWKTPKGELYQIEKLWPTARPLAHATSRETRKSEVVLWTNLYNDKTRVFGTTVGHYNEEMSDEVFLNYMSRGLLWACDKLNDDYLLPAAEPKYVQIGEPAKEAPKATGEPTPAKRPDEDKK
jgi:type 1 glutamine amidotransferase